MVGFAAETDDVLANGRAKLARKGCDLLVVNEVGDGKAFGTEDNEAVVLGADGSATPVPHGPKEALADQVWDLVADGWSNDWPDDRAEAVRATGALRPAAAVRAPPCHTGMVTLATSHPIAEMTCPYPRSGR